MLYITSLLILMVAGSNGKDYKCGLLDKCLCQRDKSKNISMDCSNRKMDLCDACDGVGNATKLDFSSNNVAVIHRACLPGCRGLESLILSTNAIRHITDEFTGMDHLAYLDLSSNSLDVYDQNGHHSTLLLPPSLTVLNLQHNLKRNLTHSYSYPDISRLQSLDILHIDGIPNAQFGFSYRRLRKLYMSGFSGVCDLKLITDDTFKNLNNVEVLDITSCNVTNIHEGAFKELHNLKYLNMSYNQQLGFSTFRNVSYSLQFTSIRTLNMSKVYNTFGIGTTIRKRDVCYLRNTTLQELVVDSNRLILFEVNALQLFPPTMQIVHFNDNKFTCGPYLLQFSCVPNVTEIHASSLNKYHDPRIFLREPQDFPTFDENITDDCPFMSDGYLQNISKSMRHCLYIDSPVHSIHGLALPRSTRKIVYRDCNMKYPVEHIVFNPLDNQIEYIDLSGNVLYSWQGPVGPLPVLKYLDLSRNCCSDVGKRFFQYMTTLENLQIQNNFIGWVLSNISNVGIFDNLTTLKTLNLSNNHITSIAESYFSNLYSLVTLDLSFNDLGEWTIDCGLLPSLAHLNISFNAFRTLPACLTSHFDSLISNNVSVRINYNGNTVSCACEHKDFVVWMLDHKANFVHYKHYTFTDTDGKRISEKEFENAVRTIDKRCASYVAYIVICVLTLSVFISVTVGGVVYRNRWKLRYILYMSKSRFFGYKRIQNEEVFENYRYDAFISYAEENIRFIVDGIIPNLDELSLCIHQRDFLAGNAVTDNIIDAIQSSRHTVVILSKAFLKSKWCIYEFNMARMESIYTRPGQRTLIVVMLEEVPIEDMPNEMSHWIRTESYLEYTDNRHGQALFWNHLAHALGHDVETDRM